MGDEGGGGRDLFSDVDGIAGLPKSSSQIPKYIHFTHHRTTPAGRNNLELASKQPTL
jgi:hypothetical protein